MQTCHYPSNSPIYFLLDPSYSYSEHHHLKKLILLSMHQTSFKLLTCSQQHQVSASHAEVNHTVLYLLSTK